MIIIMIVMTIMMIKLILVGMVMMKMMMMMNDDDDQNDAGKLPVSLLPRKYVSNLRTSPDLESGTTNKIIVAIIHLASQYIAHRTYRRCALGDGQIV